MILMQQKVDEGLDEAVEVEVERDPFESHFKSKPNRISWQIGWGREG